tara:strand:+ start:3984 stop:4694 length:711 start_codon:yes stop_codon:yes gene_type:complete
MNYFINFLQNTDNRKLYKWSQYFEVYEREFSHLREKEISFLEIGVFKGGSIPMWKGFFKNAENLTFIDIDENCLKLEEKGTKIIIGDQSDKSFLDKVIQNHGPFDVVIDDGSHMCDHQIISFEKLWPALKDNGIYLVEDTHSSYWPGFGGGYRNEASFIEYAKRIVDKMHSWWTDQDDLFPYDPFAKEINGVRFYDSIIAFTKKINKEKPMQIISVNGKVTGDRRTFDVRKRRSIF